MKLSIIIPVYNVAPYVRKCVESVLAQDLDPKDYEVILVDDGSTDGSGEICEEFSPVACSQSPVTSAQGASQPISPSAFPPNIKVIHQENQGLSMARNAGIAVAKGKYIQFVDSDDYLEPNVLAGLVEQMEREQLDVLRFDYQNVRLTPNPSPEERGIKKDEKEFEGGINGIKRADAQFAAHLYRETAGADYSLQKEHAREMRSNPTEAEDILWQHLRNSQLGHKIRRQHPINEFIADFICLEAQLVIEVDGGYHQDAEQMEEDARRTRILNTIGYEVLRLSNEEVLYTPEQTCAKIKAEIENRIQHKPFASSTSLSSGEGRGEAYEVFEPNKTPRQVDQCTEIVDGETYLNTRMGYACYAVQFMIRRSLLDDCVFMSGIHFEDTEWTPRMVLRAKRMNATTTVVYNYLMREGSITKVVDSNKLRKNLDDKFIVIDTLNRLIKTNPLCLWLRNMRSLLAEGAITTVATHFYNERKSYLKQLRTRQVFPLSLRNQSKTYLRRAMLINVSSRWYCWIRHVINL